MSPTDLGVSRKCSFDGCDSAIQASSSYLAMLAQDNEYVSCPKGHRQPLFAFASVEQERDWLLRRYFALGQKVNEAWSRRKADLTCPFHRHGIVARDGDHLIRHAIKKHWRQVETLAYAMEVRAEEK